jgi:stearoyl-CoA desaturase (delta-9 desaturase)
MRKSKKLQFYFRYYFPLYIALNTVVVALPCLLWGESLAVTFWGAYSLRSVLVYNSTWFVNSVAHMYGAKPYNK